MNVGWWCSAQKGPWSWAPQYFPGIWLTMLAILVGYVYAIRRIGPSKVAAGEPVVTRSQVLSFAVGYVLLWIATDWPLGVLGAGYLLTVHTIQYVMYSLIVAPLLIRGTPIWLRHVVLDAPGLGWARALVDRPFAAFILFNVTLALTHMPFIADRLKPIQFGSMAIDALWLVAALIFWLALGTFDEREGASSAHAKRLLYVIGITLLPTIPGAFYVYAEFPIYTTFEFATRAVGDLTAKEDQVIAGLVMWVGMTPILLFRLWLAFFDWSAAESNRAGEV
ncbi:MAG: cytochrome c oxidase assembly protein [Chloroflexi bacterium]|nr:cytochrome c oxidase assembly protein [Chloroflexota bacterium]MDA1146314.1 cytochrome c oxidase assembly protein [Chloroflexota bacterium]